MGAAVIRRLGRRLEVIILTSLTIAFLVALGAFMVGVIDDNLDYADIILMMIALMTYLVGCELAFYYFTKDDDEEEA